MNALSIIAIWATLVIGGFVAGLGVAYTGDRWWNR